MALVLVCAAAGCGTKTVLKKDPRPPRPPVDIVVKNSETVQEDTAGTPMWRISAREIRASEAATTLQVKGASVVVLGPGGQDRMRLVCPNLVANGAAKRLEASGGVSASSAENGISFKAERIEVDLPANRVTASGGVEGSNPQGRFQAGTLESDLKFEVVRLGGAGGVRATINPAAGSQGKGR